MEPTPQLRRRAGLLADALSVELLHNEQHLELDSDRRHCVPDPIPGKYLVHRVDFLGKIPRVQGVSGEGGKVCAEIRDRSGIQIGGVPPQAQRHIAVRYIERWARSRHPQSRVSTWTKDRQVLSAKSQSPFSFLHLRLRPTDHPATMSHEKGACSGLSERIKCELNLISTSQLEHAIKQERTGQGKGRRGMRKRRNCVVLPLYICNTSAFIYIHAIITAYEARFHGLKITSHRRGSWEPFPAFRLNYYVLVDTQLPQ
jgi:hypothetical protein